MSISAVSLVMEKREGILDRTYVAGQNNIYACVIVCKGNFQLHCTAEGGILICTIKHRVTVWYRVF